MSQQRPIDPNNFLPPHFAGGSVTADLAAFYRSSGAVGAGGSLANFNFVASSPASSSPYFLANFLPQQGVVSAQPVIHPYGRSQRDWPPCDAFAAPTASSAGVGQPPFGSSVDLRTSAAAIASSPYNLLDAKQLAAAAAAAAATAQYSPVLPPFFAAAAAANVASFTNALFSGPYNNATYDRQIYDLGDSSAPFANPCKITLPPTSGTDSAYLPSPLSNHSSSSTSAPCADNGGRTSRPTLPAAHASSSPNFSPAPFLNAAAMPRGHASGGRHRRATPALPSGHGAVITGNCCHQPAMQPTVENSSTAAHLTSPSPNSAHLWKKDNQPLVNASNVVPSVNAADYQALMRILPCQQQKKNLSINESNMAAQNRFQNQISLPSCNPYGQPASFDFSSHSKSVDRLTLTSATAAPSRDDAHFSFAANNRHPSSMLLNQNSNLNLDSNSANRVTPNSNQLLMSNVNLNMSSTLNLNHNLNATNFNANSRTLNNLMVGNSHAAHRGNLESNLNAASNSLNAADLDLGGVTQQFWDELDDSVLNDALLCDGSVAVSCDGPGGGAATSLLLHSVFEFPALQNAASFEEMMQTVENNSVSADSHLASAGVSRFLTAHSPQQKMEDGATVASAPTAQPHRGTAGNEPSADSVSMTPKLKEKMKRKERELAQIDRDFARHFNAIAEQEHKSSRDREKPIFPTVGHHYVAPMLKSPTMVPPPIPKEPLDQLVADLSYRYSVPIYSTKCSRPASSTVTQPSTSSPINVAVGDDEESSGCTNISVGDPLRLHSPLSAQFPHLTKYFSPKSPVNDKMAASFDDPSTPLLTPTARREATDTAAIDGEVLPSTSLAPSSTATKWAPRKSKRVPIYKQQTSKPPTTGRSTTATLTSTDPPSSNGVDSGDFSFDDFPTSATAAPLKRPKNSASTVALATADSAYCFTDDDEEVADATSSAASSALATSATSTPAAAGDASTSAMGGRRKSSRWRNDLNADQSMTSRGANSSGERSKHGSAPGGRRPRFNHQWQQAVDPSGKKLGSHAPSASSTRADEQLLEQEVRRKLWQISSLHPELRLAIANTSGGSATATVTVPSSFAEIDGNHRASFSFAEPSNGGANRYDGTATDQSLHCAAMSDDSLRHVVPKKRLSAGGRLASTSSSSPAVILPPSNLSATVSPMVQSFVRTQIIADTETAKPSKPTVEKITLTVQKPPLANLSGLEIYESTAIGGGTVKNHVEPSKPKLIIRIPKRCLSTTTDSMPLLPNNLVNCGARSDGQSCCNHRAEGGAMDEQGEHGGSNASSPFNVESRLIIDENEEERKKRKRKKKKRKKEQNGVLEEYEGMLDVDYCKIKLKKKKRSKHKMEDAQDASQSALPSLKFSVSRVNKTGETDRLRISVTEDEQLKLSDDHSPRLDAVAPSSSMQTSSIDALRVPSHPASLGGSTNRKKMRWLHSQDPPSTSSSTFKSTSYESSTTACDLRPTTAANDDVDVCATGVVVDDESASMNQKLHDQTPVFQKGAFVVFKSDLNRGDCPLWKVDSQNLLQKFLPVEQGGRLVFQGSSTYAGWCPQNQDQFVAVQVKFMQSCRSECIVQLENPLADLFPAVSVEIKDSLYPSLSLDFKPEDGLILQELNHPLKGALQTYVHILILHCVLGNYLQALKVRNDVDLLRQMSEIDTLNDTKKQKLAKDANWSEKFEEALNWYPYCTVNEDDGSGLHCQACGRNVVENVLQLFANEGYHFDTLQLRPPRTTLSGSPIPSQDFHVCPSCADIAFLYHKLTHMRYHLYMQSLDKVDLIRGDNNSMEPALIIESCLRQNGSAGIFEHLVENQLRTLNVSDQCTVFRN